MNNARRRIDWFVVITALVFTVSCSGGGCGGCSSFEPIPGGFPAAKRTANAAQVRVTSSALAKISADPAAIIGPLVGNAMNGVIDFPVPASCSGNPSICCPGGTAQATCGPLTIDLVKRASDDARLVLAPIQGANRLDLTIRARVKTGMALPITYSGIDCTVALDTTHGSQADLRIDAQIQFSQDATAGTTRIQASNVTVSQLESADVTLGGNFLCSIGGAFIGSLLGTLQSQIASQIQSTINDQVCKACPSGQVSECGSFATACTNNVCMEGGVCLQELGMDGRARGVSLFGSLSPGTTGALDLYEVTGGYASSDSNGLALGLLGGMQPGGTARDLCGPSATEPAATSIAPSVFFQGNTRPDTSAPFDVGFGLHKEQLSQFAWAGYNGGLLCLTIGHSFAAQLSTDTLALLSRSLGKLVESNSPMAVGLRPQSPPEITLGKNTFITDGMGTTTLDQPLLDIKFKAMELDFFAAIDDQYVRVFTVVSDVHLPIGLQVSGMGQLVPVIGNVADAFTNLSVKNADGVTETPAELAALFPNLLGLVLPQLSSGLSPISLPSIGGLNLAVTDITALPQAVGGTDLSYLAIFANLVVAAPARTVETSVGLAGVIEPSDAIASDPKQWARNTPPGVKLELGGDAQDLEWSYRVDEGTWSPWSTNAHPTVAPNVFWLPGDHKIDVRARRIGHPETMDVTPERIEIPLGTGVELASGGKLRRGPGNPFHGQPGGAGCACDSGGSATNAAPFALMLLVLLAPLRRVRRAGRAVWRRARRFGVVVWATALAALPGCSCSSPPCGDAACIAGDIDHGSLGRFTSIAGDDHRVMVATYDQGLGDLVAIDVTDPAKLAATVVDGIPTDSTPTHDPASYRGGIEEAGPNVGAWTSIAMSGGLAKIAYQDRDAFALKYAHETSPGHWESYVIDPGNDAPSGDYASIAIDGSGNPAIAYLAIGIDDGMGHRVTELRLARASKKEPSLSEWSMVTIAKAPGSCAGLCGGGTACVAGAAATDPETCATITASCTPACGSGDACIAGACMTPIADPKIDDIPHGTGLYVSLVLLSDGRLAATYYDQTKRALVIGVETSAGTSQFAETTLDAVTPGDRGMWSSAVVDGSGTVHVAYQDALGDQLMYTTWNGAAGTPEVVDDGQRPNDRTHNVGAAASIYLVGGAPVIAYQDGLTADVYVAAKSGATWTHNGLAMGPLLDGLSIGSTTAHGGVPYLAWGAIEPNGTPLGSVVVKQP